MRRRSTLSCLFFTILIIASCRFDRASDSELTLLAPPDTLKPMRQTKLMAMEKNGIIPLPPIDSSMIYAMLADTPRTVRIIGVGDMMLGTNYPSTNHLPPNGGRDLLADVAHILQDADLTFGNLEGTLLDEGGQVKRCSDPSKCYAFRSPESYVQHFINTGFDVVSLANNHSGDFGWEGRQKTKETLRKAKIAFAGLAGSDETTIIERDGITYGFCAFAPNSGTCDIRNLARAKQIVASLKDTSDIIIVSFHGGAEGVDNQNVPRKTERYYGENRGDVYAFAHAVIDAGADVVFGHGPHVTRAVELYNDRFIIYSLGNFCTYGRFSLRGAAGIAPLIRLHLDKEGRFKEGEVYPIYQQYTHGPRLDPRKRATAKLIELTKADFPETPLTITMEGKIERQVNLE